MKSTKAVWRLLLLLSVLPVPVEGQFTFATNVDRTLTVTGYTGPGGDITIPGTTNGLLVGTIGSSAFYNNSLVTSVTLPSTIINFGPQAFGGCINLQSIAVDTNNFFFSSLDGVLFDKRQSTLVQYPTGRAGTYTIPSSVTAIGAMAFITCVLTNITIPNSVTNLQVSAFELAALTQVTIPGSVANLGEFTFYGCSNLTDVTLSFGVTNIDMAAFDFCSSLTNVRIADSVVSIQDGVFLRCSSLATVTIPDSVMSIGPLAFESCPNLATVSLGSGVSSIGYSAFASMASGGGVYCHGNAPTLGSGVFSHSSTVYYLPETTNWNTLVTVNKALWKPQILTTDPSFGLQSNNFGFTITGSTNMLVGVQANEDPSSAAWLGLGTNRLTGGSFYFSDPSWINYPSRFYRLRMP